MAIELERWENIGACADRGEDARAEAVSVHPGTPVSAWTIEGRVLSFINRAVELLGSAGYGETTARSASETPKGTTLRSFWKVEDPTP
ncbi:MAG: hypothetical protein IPH53_12680 [Flavobacteriales bacterium]|nr:hypothetical protein [Flavobacteriales bacterium]